jgi:hypothetical protein
MSSKSLVIYENPIDFLLKTGAKKPPRQWVV